MTSLQPKPPGTGSAATAPSTNSGETAVASANGGETSATMGLKLRQLRRARGEPLESVASGTGLSSSFISLVESGRSDISFGRLVRLLDYYGVGLAELLPKPETASADVVHESERPHLYSQSEGIEMFLLTRDTVRAMMILLANYDVGGSTQEFTSHEGEEFILVLSGSIELKLSGHETRLLTRGDSVYFDASVPHFLRNPGKVRTQLLAAITPPTW